MKELDEVLTQIRKAREDYDTMTLQDNLKLSEILRTLSSNLFYLTEYRITAHERWLTVYNQSSGTNAAKEREADNQVKELYMIRHIHAQGNKLVDVIRSQIGIYKREN